jgi:hypothetical protein
MMKIKKAISINNLSLMIYYTKSNCWKYAIASENGSYESESIYYTAHAAEREGRKQIEMLLE